MQHQAEQQAAAASGRAAGSGSIRQSSRHRQWMLLPLTGCGLLPAPLPAHRAVACSPMRRRLNETSICCIIIKSLNELLFNELNLIGAINCSLHEIEF